VINYIKITKNATINRYGIMNPYVKQIKTVVSKKP